MVTPRQLVPSVGKTGVGSMDLTASSATIGDSPDLQQPIYFGSLGFHPHSPVVQSAFEELQAGVEASFGKLRFYVNKWGTLRLTDAPPSASEEPAASSTSSAEVATSSADILLARADLAEETHDEPASPSAAAS